MTSAILINCDIGERGADHPVDRDLMRYIDIANIACGGHAGDAASVSAFTGLAAAQGVEICAHLSYPDRANFGRLPMAIGTRALLEALDFQLAALPGVKRIKFHGALYNESVVNPALASDLAGWLARHGLALVLTQADSELDLSCRDHGVTVLSEAFAERRYQLLPGTTRLVLMNRNHPRAVIDNLAQAVEQAMEIACRARVAVGEVNDTVQWATLRCETLCIHSDSPIALELARALHDRLQRAPAPASAC
jgi:5-oxoprolinase (ATP-hydrolysing) subunit A